MKGLQFDPVAKRIRIVNGDRVVATTDGTLVQLLPAVNAISRAVTYAHFATDYIYTFLWGVKCTTTVSGGVFVDHYTPSTTAWVWTTAKPQERMDDIDLMAVPAGADFMAGRLRLNRTTAPSSSWQNHVLGVLPIQGEWIPFEGAFSALVEADVGMARALHLVMSGGRLLLQAQQSVGPPPGGVPASFGDGIKPGFSYAGGRLSVGAAAGIPVLMRSGPVNWSGSTTSSGPIGPPSQNSTGLATSDISSYASTYSVDIEVQFGRRS
jgi:hypothetical protein